MEFLEITDDDVTEIVRLTLEYLTDGDEVADEIMENVRTGNYFGYKAVKEGKIVGFMTFKQGIGFTTPQPRIEDTIRRIADGKKVFIADGLWVSPDVRGHGVGAKLCRMIGQGIKKAGGDYLLIEEWIYPDGDSPVRALADQWGTPVYDKHVPLFYKDISKYGMTCPICGKDCKCSAKIRLYDTEDIKDEEQ